MKKLILFLSLAFVLPASAQLTITYEMMLSQIQGGIKPSDSYSSTDVTGVAAIIANSGAAKTWDFGGRTYTKDATGNTNQTYVDPSTAPMHSDPDFAGATHCIKVPGDDTDPTISYSYIKIDASGYYVMGIATDSAGVQAKFISYVPPMQSMKFPLTYGTTWSSTSNINVDIGFPGATLVMKIDANCDGYGTLSIPTIAHKGENPVHSSTECLRIRQALRSVISFSGFEIGNSLSHSYSFISTSETNGFISSDTNDVPMDIGYSQAAGSSKIPFTIDDPMTIKLSSNPASSGTTLSYNLPESGDVNVSMMDNLGREVKMLHNGFAPAGSNVIPIDPSTMTNGTYLIRISSDSFTGTRKLVIAK
ncbi:MAG TPA: T9SS type A sorting domain-containing protein [Candidatus Kapabacteria bacterium]